MTDSTQRKRQLSAICAEPGFTDARQVIRSMKMRGGFETDTALAAFLGRSQSAIAHWRRNGQVPEGAVVRFEQRIKACRTA
ncbi:hypothetical protein [Sphingomonas sp.]|uniref:hypothetical protein n=1 Tax=Sphingomonas sp. TaxID=28214 RepID=UPI002DD674C9|nr:hypothetical protein [Sphingomonas sp.]